MKVDDEWSSGLNDGRALTTYGKGKLDDGGRYGICGACPFEHREPDAPVTAACTGVLPTLRSSRLQTTAFCALRLTSTTFLDSY